MAGQWNCIVNVTVLPSQTVHLNKSDVTVKSLNSGTVYSVLVEGKTRLPRGLLHWCEELQLTDIEIQTSLTFARLCSRQIFDHVFQFKIVTRILPTNQYLTRYRVKDSELCSRCLEIDTVQHSIWSCGTIAPFISYVVVFLNTKCTVGVDINMKQYMFGFQGNKFLGLNHVLLELKKYIFYNFEENVGVAQLFERFNRRIMHLMIKEKMLALSAGNYEIFRVKWENFTEIYDFYGPNCQVIAWIVILYKHCTILSSGMPLISRGIFSGVSGWCQVRHLPYHTRAQVGQCRILG